MARTLDDNVIEQDHPTKGFSAQQAKTRADKKSKLKDDLISTLKEIIVALIIIGIIMGSVWAYAGNWPPLVVVESDSMMHDSDSSVGIMDTGDMVIVKSVSNRKEIKSYIKGKKDGYQSYGSFGDVIGFRKNGRSGTPVIHRAVVWLEYNESGNNNDTALAGFGSFDIPELGLFDVTRFTIENYKPDTRDLDINLLVILRNYQQFGIEPNSGFLTKGDKNVQIDQISSLQDSKGFPVMPVKLDWVVGKAKGELPWFGLIKLYSTGKISEKSNTPPPTSVSMLFFSVVLIIILVIVWHLLFLRIERTRRRKREIAEEKKLRHFKNKIARRFQAHEISSTPDPTRNKFKPVEKGEVTSYLDEIIDIDASLESKNSCTSQSSPKLDSNESTIPTPIPAPIKRVNGPARPLAKPVNSSIPPDRAKNGSARSSKSTQKVSDDEMIEYLDDALEKTK
jgi:signal peptidase